MTTNIACNLKINVFTSLHFSVKWTDSCEKFSLLQSRCVFDLKKRKQNSPLNNSNEEHEEIDIVEERKLFLQTIEK